MRNAHDRHKRKFTSGDICFYSARLTVYVQTPHSIPNTDIQADLDSNPSIVEDDVSKGAEGLCSVHGSTAKAVPRRRTSATFC